MKTITLDSTSNRYFDENGYLVIKDNKIAKSGVFEYLGREISDNLPETEIYKVYRSFEELEKSAKDFEGMPLKYGHEWVEPSKRDLKVGSVSGEVKLDKPYLVADIKIYDKGAIENIINKNIVELSPGYKAEYVNEVGEYNGEKYEFVQKDIIYNHLAIVENGRSGKEVRINDNKPKELGNKNKEVDNMPKDLKQDALYALSHAKKVYDEYIASKTEDVDKQELVREIVATAVKPDTDFEGGENEKLEIILKIAEKLGYSPAEPQTADNDEVEKTEDSDVVAMKEAFNSFASLFSAFLDEEEKEEVHTSDNEVEEKAEEKKQVSDGNSVISKKVMDAEINKAINNERKRTQDAIVAYQEVEKHTGTFNMAGMTEEEIYQYAYETLTGEKVKVSDAKPSFKAYVKAKVNDSGINSNYVNSADDFFTHIK